MATCKEVDFVLEHGKKLVAMVDYNEGLSKIKHNIKNQFMKLVNSSLLRHTS